MKPHVDHFTTTGDKQIYNKPNNVKLKSNDKDWFMDNHREVYIMKG